MAPKPIPVSERLWRHVTKTDGCWLWTGANNGRGYGVIGSGVTGKNAYVHRVSYELAFGPVPDGLVVCHRCDVPACVRPDHLFAGTQLENLTDMSAKGRARPYDRRGARNPRAVLTAEQAMEVRRLRIGGQTLASIAKEFGISPSQVHRIAASQAWSEPA